MVQVFLEELGTSCSTVAVKDCVVCNCKVLIDLHVLNHHVAVLHCLPLANVAHERGVEPFDQKLESSNSKRVAWPQVVLVRLEQSPVDPARIQAVQVQVP